MEYTFVAVGQDRPLTAILNTKGLQFQRSVVLSGKALELQAGCYIPAHSFPLLCVDPMFASMFSSMCVRLL